LNKAFRIAFGGIICAICIALMLCTGLFPFATVALPALAGLLMVSLVIEFGVKWAYLAYGVVAVVSFFLTPDKSAMLMFVFFFGVYPIAKASIERIRKRMLEWAMKFLLANAALILLFFLARWFLGLTEVMPDIHIFGKFTFLVFWLAANAVFLVYDLALTRVIGAYIHWFKPNYIDRLRRNRM
jgi:hypothetical protein